MSNDNKKETSGNRISFYIFPPSTSFPWVQAFKHPYGIKGKQEEVDSLDVRKGSDPDDVALALGRMVLKHSPILLKWFEEHGTRPVEE